MAFKPRKGIELSTKLVIVGVPAKVAAIVGAAAFDQRNLSPGCGCPVSGEPASLVKINLWFQALTGKTLDQVATPKPGAIPELPRATRGDVEVLLDQLFGVGRPDLEG